MIDEALRSRVAAALEQSSAEVALTQLVHTLEAEGISRSELIELYHESLLNHLDDADQTKHDAVRSVLSTITGVPPARFETHRPWSRLQKAQFAAACFGAGITLFVPVLDLFQLFEFPKDSAIGGDIFLVCMLIFVPAGWIAEATGIGPSAWCIPLALLVNAAICYLVITIIAFLARLLRIKARPGAAGA